MRPGGGGVAAAVTKMNVLPLFSRAEQWPFKIPVHVPGWRGELFCRVHMEHVFVVGAWEVVRLRGAR